MSNRKGIKCVRCETTEAHVECGQCDSDSLEPVFYCSECSELVHKGRLSRHEVTTICSKEQCKDVEAKLVTYNSQTTSIQKRQLELKLASDTIMERKRIFERNLYKTVHLIQQELKEKARQLRQEASEHCAVKQAELAAAKEELDSHIAQRKEFAREVTAMIEEGGNRIQVAADVVDKQLSEAAASACCQNLPSVQLDFRLHTGAISQTMQELQTQVISCTTPGLAPDYMRLPPINIEEGTEMSVRVQAPMSRSGTFWLTPAEVSSETAATLYRINLLIRDHFIHTPELRSCQELGLSPQPGDLVYSKLVQDSQWYRAKVIEIRPDKNLYCVMLLDHGSQDMVPLDHLVPMQSDCLPDTAYQATECCLFPELQTNLQVEPRWAFNDLIMDQVLKATFKNKVPSGDMWYVQLDITSASRHFDVNQVVEQKIKKLIDKPAITCRDIRLKDDPGLLEPSPPAEPSGDQSEKPAVTAKADHSGSKSVTTETVGAGSSQNEPSITTSGDSRVNSAAGMTSSSLNGEPLVAEYQQEAARKADVAAVATETADATVVPFSVKEAASSGSKETDTAQPPPEASEENGGSGSEARQGSEVEAAACETTKDGSDGPARSSVAGADGAVAADVTEGAGEVTSEATGGNDVPASEAINDVPASEAVNDVPASEAVSEDSPEDGGIVVHSVPGNVSLDLPKSLGSESEEYVTPREEVEHSAEYLGRDEPGSSAVSHSEPDRDHMHADGDQSMASPDGDILQRYLESVVKTSISMVHKVPQETQAMIHDDEAILSAVPCSMPAEMTVESSPENAYVVDQAEQTQDGPTGPADCPALNPEAPEFLLCSPTSPSKDRVTPRSYQPPLPIEMAVQLSNGHCEQAEQMNGHPETTASDLPQATLEDTVTSSSDCDTDMVEGGSVLVSSPQRRLPNPTVLKQAIKAAVTSDGEVSAAGLVQPLYQESSSSSTVSTDVAGNASDNDTVLSSEETSTEKLSSHSKYGPPRSKRLAATKSEPAAAGDSVFPPQLVGLQTGSSSREPSPHRAIGRSRGRGSDDKRAREVKPGTDGAMKSHAHPNNDWSAAKADPPVPECALPAGVISGDYSTETANLPAKGGHAASPEAAVTDSSLPTMPSKPGESMKVRVVSPLEEDGSFHVCPIHTPRQQQQLKTLMEEINKLSTICPDVESPIPLQQVFAKDERSCWKRGRVEVLQGKKALVTLIDFGKIISVSLLGKGLLQVPDLFNRYPAQSATCSLSTREYGVFNKEAQDLFKQLTDGKDLLMEVVNPGDRGLSYVKLLDYTSGGSEAINIYQMIYDQVPRSASPPFVQDQFMDVNVPPCQPATQQPATQQPAMQQPAWYVPTLSKEACWSGTVEVPADEFYHGKQERHGFMNAPPSWDSRSQGSDDSGPHAGRSNRQCFKCGQLGHIAANCGRQMSGTRCFKCNQMGHVQHHCPGGDRASGITCHYCHQLGHTKVNCPQKFSSSSGGKRPYCNN